MTLHHSRSSSFALSKATRALAALVGFTLPLTLSPASWADSPSSSEAPVVPNVPAGSPDEVEEVDLPGSQSDAAAGAEAEALAERGREAVKREDFEGAYEAFREAFRRSHHYAIAGSLAVVEMKLGRYADAAVHWEFFLQHLEETASEKRAAVMAQLEACRKRLGRVAVRTNAPGAVLVVDGKVIGPMPRDVWLASGRHSFVARLENRTSGAQLVDVAVGREGVVTVDLPEPSPLASSLLSTSPPESAPDEEASPVLAPPAPAEESGLGAREYVLFGGAVLTLAGLGTGGLGLWKASSLSDDADTLIHRIDQYAAETNGDPDTICTDSVRSRPDECAELDDLEWRRKQMDTLATVAFVSAAGIAVATGVTYWLWPAQGERAASAQSTGDSARAFVPAVAPWATDSGAGVVLALPWR